MWMPVPGYEEQYEASDAGEFRRISTRSGRVLDQPKPLRFGTRRGYCGVMMCRDGLKTTHMAHRIVWLAFRGEIPPGIQINHKNGDKRDNRLSNLELATPSENTRHAYSHLGRKPAINRFPGEMNARAKLSNADIPKIFAARALGLSQQKIADMFGIDQTGVSRILLKKSYKIS